MRPRSGRLGSIIPYRRRPDSTPAVIHDDAISDVASRNKPMILLGQRPSAAGAMFPVASAFGGVPDARHCMAVKCGAEADASHAGRLKLGDRHRAGPRTDQHVDGFGRDGLHHGPDRVHVRQEWRIEYIGADFGERDEAPDRVVQIGPAEQVVVRASGQQDTPLRHAAA